MGAHNLLGSTNSAIEIRSSQNLRLQQFPVSLHESRESGSQGFSNMTTTGSLEAVVTSSAHGVMTP